jgi:hypothetical protein
MLLMLLLLLWLRLLGWLLLLHLHYPLGEETWAGSRREAFASQPRRFSFAFPGVCSL